MGTVTFRVEVSTTTTIVISFIVSVPLAVENAYLIGPGDPQIGLNLTTVVLVDGAWIFIFSVVLLEVGTFHLAFNTDALPLSPTGQTSKPQRCCPALERTTRGPLDSSSRFPEWCS